MKLDIVASSQNDEFYTPKYAVLPIIPYLESRGYNRIWCPFDTPDSNFVKLLGSSGFEVTASHISSGSDFFTEDTPIGCECIVSNPPYSLKTEVLTNLFERNMPFAMLLGVVGLFESETRFSLFEKYPFEVLYFNRRVAYFRDFTVQKPDLNPPFSSVYVCHNVLPSQICFSRINKADV